MLQWVSRASASNESQLAIGATDAHSGGPFDLRHPCIDHSSHELPVLMYGHQELGWKARVPEAPEGKSKPGPVTCACPSTKCHQTPSLSTTSLALQVYACAWVEQRATTIRLQSSLVLTVPPLDVETCVLRSLNVCCNKCCPRRDIDRVDTALTVTIPVVDALAHPSETSLAAALLPPVRINLPTHHKTADSHARYSTLTRSGCD